MYIVNQNISNIYIITIVTRINIFLANTFLKYEKKFGVESDFSLYKYFMLKFITVYGDHLTLKKLIMMLCSDFIIGV